MADRFRRVRFVHEIVSRPIFKAVVIVLAVLGTVSTVRELLLPEQLQGKLNFYKLWSLSWPWYIWALVVVVAILVVVFEGAFAAVAKREKLLHDHTTADDLDSDAEGTSGRDEFVIIAGQLRHFLDARRADYDSEFGGGAFPTLHEQYLDMQEIAIGDTGKRARKKAAMKSKHRATTLQMYGDQFASRVLSADLRLRERGVNKAKIGHLGKYPSTIGDIEAIVGELESASAALPSIPIPETTEERLWSLRYQAEAPELAMKILTGPKVNSGPKPYLVIDYVSAWRYASDQDPDEDEERVELEEFLKFTNASNEVIRRIQVDTLTIWGVEISTESVPTLIHHGEPVKRRVRRIEDQLKKANIGLRAFHKKPVGVPLMVTYYGQSDDQQYLGRHALVYDKGDIRVEPMIDGADVDWLDASEVVAIQDENG